MRKMLMFQNVCIWRLKPGQNLSNKLNSFEEPFNSTLYLWDVMIIEDDEYHEIKVKFEIWWFDMRFK